MHDFHKLINIRSDKIFKAKRDGIMHSFALWAHVLVKGWMQTEVPFLPGKIKYIETITMPPHIYRHKK